MAGRIARDSRELHDQVIDHGLGQLSTERLMALIVIELRRLREDLAGYHERERPKGDDGRPGQPGS